MKYYLTHQRIRLALIFGHERQNGLEVRMGVYHVERRMVVFGSILSHAKPLMIGQKTSQSAHRTCINLG